MFDVFQKVSETVEVSRSAQKGSPTMTTAKSNRNAARPSRPAPMAVESPREITHDIVEYLTEYARQKPGYAALCCIGIGFVLGWKLKPW